MKSSEIKGVVIPENCAESARLIIEEAAAVLKGHAKRMHEMAGADDWKSKTAAMITMDHVKKLAWVHGLLAINTESNGSHAPGQPRVEVSSEAVSYRASSTPK